MLVERKTGLPSGARSAISSLGSAAWFTPPVGARRCVGGAGQVSEESRAGGRNEARPRCADAVEAGSAPALGRLVRSLLSAHNRGLKWAGLLPPVLVPIAEG